VLGVASFAAFASPIGKDFGFLALIGKVVNVSTSQHSPLPGNGKEMRTRFKGEARWTGSNLNSQCLGYLLELLLELPIDLQSLLKSCDCRVDGGIFQTAGEFPHFSQS
jgi:hypothetical protein